MLFFYLPELSDHFLSFTIFPFLFFLSIGWYGGVRTDGVYITLSQPCTADSYNNNNNNNMLGEIRTIARIM